MLDEKLLGLVEMTSGLVNAGFSLPEWEAVKMIFFAPCPFNRPLKEVPHLLSGRESTGRKSDHLNFLEWIYSFLTLRGTQ